MATYNDVKKIKIGSDVFNLYSSGGTVTSVGITNGGGLTVTGSPVTSSGSITLTLNAATSSTLGGIKTGYSASGTNYAVALDANNKAYVSVPWTDTKVTAVGNHYSPTTDSSAGLSASASGATAAWGIDVVKAVQLQRDAKGHVTGVTVTSGKIPTNPNTDTKVRQTYSSDSSAYPLLMTATSGTGGSTTRDDEAKLNNNIYAKPSEGAIYAKALKADEGVFNKLVATDANFQNATVVGLLDVQGELHTNSWTNANIANIGGSFYISPTIEPSNSSTTISITKTTSGSTVSWTVEVAGTFATNFVRSGTSTTGVVWPAGSSVLITGDITLSGTEYPLGTLKGTLSSQVEATAEGTPKTVTLTNVRDAQDSTNLSVLNDLYTINNGNISNATFSNGKISLYRLNDKPIGILLSSMGSATANSVMDIYGGVATDPQVRIGHLIGLPSFTIGGKTTVQPTGWGIYTDNGYFKGVIASDSGVIGGWTIGSSAIYNDTNSKTSTTAGTYLGTDAIRNYKTATQYVHIEDGKITALGVEVSGEIKATSGFIGQNATNGFTISNTAIYNPTTKSSLSSDTVDGIYLGKDGIALGKGLFKVTNAGALTAKSGTIGGWTIDADNLKSSSGSVGLKGSGSTSTDIVFWAGNSTPGSAPFRVTRAGDFTATSGSIGSSVTIGGTAASTVVSNASNALANAAAAQSTADGAASAAGAAQSTADAAASAASGAQSTADGAATAASNAAKTATSYITSIDTNKGITLKPSDSSGNDYLQINSSAITMYRNNVETMKLEDSAFRIGKVGTNLRNVYITDSAVQIRNNTSVLAEYGSSITIYKPGTTTAAVSISSSSATFSGNVNATSLSTGTKTASTTGNGTFIDSNGAIYVGNGSTNNFTVTSAGALTATGANVLTATIGNANNKISLGTGTTGNSAIWYGMSTLASTSNGFYIGTDGISLGGGKFKVTAAGAITATSLSIAQSQVTDLDTTLAGKASSSAEYSVEIATSNIQDTSCTLTATVYKLGTKQTGSFSYSWYKGDTAIGGNSATLNVTDLNAVYTCIVS